MFTGIVEATGIIKNVSKEEGNLRFSIQSPFTNELKIDQSISHNGVCLTVTKITGEVYEVIAIDETLRRSNLGKSKAGDEINLERCTKLGDRLDGHIVQGHVDTIGTIKKITDQQGSHMIYISYGNEKYITVEKGSITVNGVSLTVVDSVKNNFSVAIIPYTFENTNCKSLKVGDEVNLEFDIIGKYVAKILDSRCLMLF